MGAGGEGSGSECLLEMEFWFRTKKESWQWMGGRAHHGVNVGNSSGVQTLEHGWLLVNFLCILTK